MLIAPPERGTEGGTVTVGLRKGEEQMQKLSIGSLAICVACGVVAGSFAAETQVVVGSQQTVAWTSKGKSSTARAPLVLDGLKTGDIVEIQIPAGPIPHGFAAIKKSGNSSTEVKDAVLTCGEDPKAKPNAVLRETECSGASKVGTTFKGSLKLEVLDTLKDDLNFWCVVHRAAMPGIIKAAK